MTRKPRTPAKPGLSLVDANQGRLVTYEQDVLDIKAEIERRWAGLLSVFFDNENIEWVIVEHCVDGTDRIFTVTKALSQATIDKIHKADQASRSFEDLEENMQREDAKRERDLDHSLSESIGESSERLFFALRKDGIIDRPTVYF